MSMRFFKIISWASLLNVLFACATKTVVEAGADREPATQNRPVPYIPGSPSANRHNNNAQTNSNTPVVPPRADLGPPPRGHSSSSNDNANNRRDRPQGPTSAPTLPREDMATCEPPLASWRFGYTETRNHHGNIRRDISVLDAMLNGGGSRGSITGNLDLDKSILREWIGSGLNKNSPAFQAAQYSPIYKAVFDYLISSSSDYYGQPGNAHQMIGAKAAVYISALIAVSDNPECMAVVEHMGNQMFQDLNATQDMGPYRAASAEFTRSIQNYLADLRLGKEQSKFHELDNNRRGLQNDYNDLERGLKNQQRDIERASQNFMSALNREASRINKMITQNTSCSRSYTQARSNTAKQDVDALASRVEDCIHSLQQHIARLEDKRQELENQGRSGSALYRDTERNIARHQTNLDLLNADTESSAQSRVKALQKFAQSYRDIEEKQQALLAEEGKLKAKEQQLQQISTPWLTYGYAGQFLVR